MDGEGDRGRKRQRPDGDAEEYRVNFLGNAVSRQLHDDTGILCETLTRAHDQALHPRDIPNVVSQLSVTSQASTGNGTSDVQSQGAVDQSIHHSPSQLQPASGNRALAQAVADLNPLSPTPPAQVSIAPGPRTAQVAARQARASEGIGWKPQPSSLLRPAPVPAPLPSSVPVGNPSAISMLQLEPLNPALGASALLQLLARSQQGNGFSLPPPQPNLNLVDLVRQLHSTSAAVNPATIHYLLQSVRANPTYHPPPATSLFVAQLVAAAQTQQALQNASGSSDSLLSLLTQQPVPQTNLAAAALNLPVGEASGLASGATATTQVAPELARMLRAPSMVSSAATTPNGATPVTRNDILRPAYSSESRENPRASDDEAVLLYRPSDETKISPYQCLARQQLEFFRVSKGDLEAGAQGRNRPIKLHQVGIRCKWCAQLPHRQKQRASTYYPAKLSGVYQTAQNITNSHLMQLCQCIPADIQQVLRLLQAKKSGTGGGRDYWTGSARQCGVEEADGGGLKLTPSQETAEQVDSKKE